MFKDDSLLKHYLNPIFVETGTLDGDGVNLALNTGFKQIYSVEIVEERYNFCVNRFVDNKNVKLYLGDSLDTLPAILASLNDKTTFWLDAHVNSKIDKVFGKFKCPILEEIKLIVNNEYSDTILIDDIRLFRNNGKGKFNYIKLNDILKEIPSNFEVSYAEGFVQDDIMVVKRKLI